MSNCISFADWMPHVLLAALVFGMAVGGCLRLGIDRAELAAYRRIARLTEDEIREWNRPS